MHWPRLAQHHALWLLLLVLGTFTNGCRANPFYVDPLNATLELDLVFPRPNVTYKPTYPFPLVFAFQGMEEAWPHHVGMSTRVRVATLEAGKYDTTETSRFPDDLPYEERTNSYDYPSSRYTVGDSPGGRDTVFFTVGLSNVVNSTEKTIWVTYDVFFQVNCTMNDHRPLVVKQSVGSVVLQEGEVTFNLDAENGLDPIPGLTEEDECVTGLATIQMRGSIEGYGPGILGQRQVCPVLDEEDLHPEPEPCRVSLPEDMHSSVASLMLQTASCTTGSWPAETLVAPCGHDMSASADDDDDSAASYVFPPTAVLLGGVAGLATVLAG